MPPDLSPQDVAIEAETHLRLCHTALRSIKNRDQRPYDPVLVHGFQSRLMRSLYGLEHAVLGLKTQVKQHEALFAAGTPEANSSAQILALRSNIAALEQLVDYGRNLGDAFAWLFYRKDEEQLRRHHAHPRIQHSAVGTGGLGEVIFADNFQKMNDQLVIHHNLTTFLRIGDFSLVNLASGAIEGIGELKTKKNADGTVTMNVSMVGKKSAIRMPILPGVPTAARDGRERLDPAIAARLRRQEEIMRAAFRPAAPLTGKILPLDPTPRQLVFDPFPLVALFAAATPTAASFKEVSPGLRLLGIKSPAASLVAQAFNSEPVDAMSIIGEAMADVRTLFLPGSAYNVVESSFLIYPTRERYALGFGNTPTMWWPIPQNVIDALVDRSFMVQCLFNPAFLISRLEKQGYHVHRKAPDAPLVLEVPQTNGQPLCFGGLDYFIELAARHLITEDSVFHMIVGVAEEMKLQNLPPDSRVSLHLSFREED